MASNPLYSSLPHENIRAHDDDDQITQESDGLISRRNFIIFCLLFSIVHGCVDSVLAFSAAELGTKLGSSGGFTLYIFYTTSSFFIAKPVLQWLGAKRAVLIGLLGMLIYVAAFFLAIIIPKLAVYIFLCGAAVGGMGAGLLWTAQGSYYASNASEYSALVNHNRTQVLTRFAGIFALFYLSFETFFKFTATIVFVSSQQQTLSWRPTVFGLYTASAAIAITIYVFIVDDYHEVTVQFIGEDHKVSHSWRTVVQLTQRAAIVAQALQQPKLLLCIPFQLCFGFSTGLIDTYVNGIIVKSYLGDGYIGLFAGLTTLTAALLASPCAIISHRYDNGSYSIMLFGAACFAFGGLLLLTLSDAQIAFWPIITCFYLIHGVARGIWENTNKAMIAILFPVDEQRDTAYAAVYFASGLAGALGFLFFQFLSKPEIAIVNLTMSCLALVCFHFAYVLHQRCEQEEALASVHGLTRSNSDSSLDSLIEQAP
jgi:MFS family permease